jgi:hypothetical protein
MVQPSGGEEIVSKNSTFHYDSIDGFKVIRWADRGLTYALVSDLEGSGFHSQPETSIILLEVNTNLQNNNGDRTACVRPRYYAC